MSRVMPAAVCCDGSVAVPGVDWDMHESTDFEFFLCTRICPWTGGVGGLDKTTTGVSARVSLVCRIHYIYKVSVFKTFKIPLV